MRCVLNSASTHLCKGLPLLLLFSLFPACAVFVCCFACKRCQRQSNVHSTQAFPGAVTQKGKKERGETEPGCVAGSTFSFCVFSKMFTQRQRVVYAICCSLQQALKRKPNHKFSPAAIRNELLAEVGTAEPDEGAGG